MIVHPSRHYIYYLMSRRTMSTVDIIEHLKSMDLPVPRKEDEFNTFVDSLTATRKKMAVPSDFDPEQTPVNSSTSRFLKKWKIYDLSVRDPQCLRMMDLATNDFRLRQFLETLLLGPLQLHDVAARAQSYFGLSDRELNVGVVRAFSHYMWDYGGLSDEQWLGILYHGYNLPRYNLIQTLVGPRDSAGAALSLANAGVEGSLASNAMYATARQGFFKMMMGHFTQNKVSVDNTQGAFMALQGLMNAEDRLDRHRGASAELLDELNRIETIYDKKKVPSIRDVPSLKYALPPGRRYEAEIIKDEDDNGES